MIIQIKIYLFIIYLYFPTGSNLDDQRITVLSAAPEANILPLLEVAKQKTFSLCPKIYKKKKMHVTN
jgi:hypothetical protein